MNILDFQQKKSRQKISMMTCYDYSFAKILNQSSLDALLVGDSAAMVMFGHPTTLQANMQMMELLTAAVVKGAPQKLVVADLPFLSYRKGLKAGMDAVEILMKAGAQAVKLEGADGNEKFIHDVVQSGVPVMGHLGLTPQSIHQLGGFKVQGRNERAAEKIYQDAQTLQKAGCFSLVLECVPSIVAKKISLELEIPVIGIGAGSDVDGQVLVLQDMLGFDPTFKPKFLRSFAHFQKNILETVNHYHEQVQQGLFPNESESYL